MLFNSKINGIVFMFNTIVISCKIVYVMYHLVIN